MSISGKTNDFFLSHQGLFMSILFTVLAVIFTLFIGSLIHVLKGVRYPFVVLLNLAVLQSVLCYGIYAFQYEVSKSHFSVWYFLSLLSFGMYHWILAFRYYTSAREMPYVLDQKPIPERNKWEDNGVKWTGLVLLGLASFFVFPINDAL
jgi:hypothetical protein